MKYPKQLTADEWNFLIELTTYNHMDSWFTLCQDKAGNDYVYDEEERKRIALRTGLRQVAEGMYEKDLVLFDNGHELWNTLMLKFNLGDYCL